MCVSFSGGKDSTVLLHIARQLYHDIPAVFSNTGLEYFAIQKFVKTWDKVKTVTPKMRFDEVMTTYGYPLIGKEVSGVIASSRKMGNSPIFKRNALMGKNDTKLFDFKKWLPLAQNAPFLISNKCCDKMKKQPMHQYYKETGAKPIIATLAEESLVRRNSWIANGCNAFEGLYPHSNPISFWTEQDVLSYLVKNRIPIASVYGEIVSVGDDGNHYPPTDLCGNANPNLKCTGCQRTGCVYCAFGAHRKGKGENRFLQLAQYEPRKYEYAIKGGQWVDNPFYDPAAPKMDGDWQNWNPKKIWTPSKKGLGMGKVFDIVNEIYVKDFIKYD